jgi:hypothetical protein
MTFSFKQHFERMGAGSGNEMLRSQQPMDAGYVWTLIDNVAHLVDESPKYRINFMHNSPEFSNAGIPGPVREFYFFSQTTQPNQYSRFDIRVAMGLGVTSGLTVRATLCTPSTVAPVGTNTQGVLASFTGVTPAASTVVWSIDDTTDAVDVNNAPIVSIPAAHYVTSDVTIGHVVLLKLIVEYDFVTGEGGPTSLICGVQVREFLV